MTKIRILDAPKIALNRECCFKSLDDNIRFYDRYFYTEETKRKSFMEILSELGDPRILARTLIDAADRAGDAYAHEANETQFRGASGTGPQDSFNEETFTRRGAGTVHKVRMPGWLIAILVLMAVVVVISVVGSLMWANSPTSFPSSW